MSSVSLTSVPPELVLDYILPRLSTKDVLSLGATNCTFAKLVEDNLFWRDRTRADFNFPDSNTARLAGWKYVYKKLSQAQIFGWGHASTGRFGRSLQDVARSMPDEVPYPVRLGIPGVNIVEVIASGWSFHYLDSKGQLYVTGVLDGAGDLDYNRHGFSRSDRVTEVPMKLELPVLISLISCGWKHSMALDFQGFMWIFMSWGCPIRVTSPLLDQTCPETTASQIVAGWNFGAVLTASGDVLVFWTEDLRALQRDSQANGDDDKTRPKSGNVLQCVPEDRDVTLTRLTALPQLPELVPDPAGGSADGKEETRLVKIAAMNSQLIALTNKGHVLKYDNLWDAEGATHARWSYLPYFSDVNELRRIPVYTTKDGQNQPTVVPPTALRVTHISANRNDFAAYSLSDSSAVLLGTVDTTPTTHPKVIPSLQNKSVISVVVGDFHFAALTTDGKVYTWGQYMKGCLGLGDPSKGRRGRRHQAPRALTNVTEPSEVHFDWDERTGERSSKESFCISITAAGWHTGALVAQMSENREPETSSGSGSWFGNLGHRLSKRKHGQ